MAAYTLDVAQRRVFSVKIIALASVARRLVIDSTLTYIDNKKLACEQRMPN